MAAWLVAGHSLPAWAKTAAPSPASKLPVVEAELTFVPNVPPPIARKTPAIVRVHLEATEEVGELGAGVTYILWGFNGHVPGPVIRARVGDYLAVHVTNAAKEMPHNVDFHAVTGQGGGASVLTVSPGEEAVGYFLLRHPGLFVYHCAAPPVPDHIANG
ncbi:MAG: multicopper oxidase domain-containing protein, partial [Candidatus Omnitrophica bacterium]|nr:multicopper oxidase domain-containing protein [Candidatus Omnitrophota bacterium]